MAAYAHAVTSDMRRASKIGDVVGIGLFAGQVDITNYNSTTKPEIVGISGKFKKVIAVTFDVSDTGYVFRWDDVNKTIEALYADYDAVADGALIEAVTDLDVGQATFMAIGLV